MSLSKPQLLFLSFGSCFLCLWTVILFGVFRSAVVPYVSGFVVRAHSFIRQKDCERLLPYIEVYRTQKNSYPKSLTVLYQFSPLPDQSYHCGYARTVDILKNKTLKQNRLDNNLLNSQGFELWTVGPDGATAYFDSQTKQWRYVWH